MTDDLISRQAAINEIKEFKHGAAEWRDEQEERSDIWHRADSAIASALEIGLRVKKLPSEQRWIPVSERLPEVNGRYLVTRGLNACDSLWNRIYIANYTDLMGIKSERIWWQGNVGKSDFEHIDDVIAWMPLPKPYKEGKNDGEIH